MWLHLNVRHTLARLARQRVLRHPAQTRSPGRTDQSTPGESEKGEGRVHRTNRCRNRVSQSRLPGRPVVQRTVGLHVTHPRPLGGGASDQGMELIRHRRKSQSAFRPAVL